jgi:acyl transferase domain-containing protein
MRKTALIFPGQGAFYAGVLRQARFIYLAVERVLSIIEAVALRRLGRSLIGAMWDESSNAEYLLKSQPDLLQLGIFAVSVAVHEILKTEGVEADVLMGHSFGEITALTCAGVYTIAQGAEIVCDRVESLAAAAPQDGCMAAVSASPKDVRILLDEWVAQYPVLPVASMLTLAVENHDKQTVVSGSQYQVNAFIGYCTARNLLAQRLRSPYGFHHPALAPVVTIFAARLAGYSPSPLLRPVYSPILGRYYCDDDAFGDCLAGHLVLPVAFSSGIRFLQTEGVTHYIECGALDALSKIVVRVLGVKGAQTYPTCASQSVELDNVLRIVNSLKEEHNYSHCSLTVCRSRSVMTRM